MPFKDRAWYDSFPAYLLLISNQRFGAPYPHRVQSSYLSAFLIALGAPYPTSHNRKKDLTGLVNGSIGHILLSAGRGRLTESPETR